jgi:hypothetical protein
MGLGGWVEGWSLFNLNEVGSFMSIGIKINVNHYYCFINPTTGGSLN